MAKVIKYNLATKVNCGTPENPEHMITLSRVEMPWSEANEEIANCEAYDGYTIEDDGQPEAEAQPSEAERIAELEEALALLLSGVTE